MSTERRTYIGTSGWHYKHWRGVFYPDDLLSKNYLNFYIKHFCTTEINNTFYQLPEEKTFIEWRESTPDGFVFSVKASRYITHMKKLKDPFEPVDNFLKCVRALKQKLGPILFQLPPRWHINLKRLKEFLEILPEDHRYAFEFRDRSWLDEKTYNLLSEYGASLCIYDFDGFLSPEVVTTDLVYIRLHGPDGPYRGSYNTEALSKWANNISNWSDDGKEVYCYFDNDERGYAVENALKLIDMLNRG